MINAYDVERVATTIDSLAAVGSRPQLASALEAVSEAIRIAYIDLASQPPGRLMASDQLAKLVGSIDPLRA